MRFSDAIQSRRSCSGGIHSAQIGCAFLYAAAFLIFGVGLAALFTAVTIILLPHEEAFLRASPTQITAHHHDASLINFIIHNRVAFGGTLLSIGVLYAYVIHDHLRQGRQWAWWALILSGLIGGSSYFSFVFSNYLDRWHGVGTAVILLAMGAGLLLTYRHLRKQTWISLNLRPCRLPRFLLFIWAMATFLGGLAIFFVGVSTIFVPQDLTFM